MSRALDDRHGRGVRDAEEMAEQRMLRLLEATRVIPWEADARTWLFTYVGPQAEALTGYPAERWYEEAFWERHIHDEDRELALTFCAESSKSLDDYEFEYRMIAADGSVVWLHDIVHVLRELGEPRVLQGFMIDVTQRKEAEQALRRTQEALEARVAARTRELELSESRLKEAQQIARFGNWERDLATNALWLSDEAFRLLGLDPETSEGAEARHTIHPDDRARARAALDAVRANGRPVSLEHRIVLPSGETRHIHVHVVMERDAAGAPARIAGTFQDITEQVQLQRDVIGAGEHERRRVGHDLHDGLGQELTGISLSLQALSSALAHEGSAQRGAALDITRRTQKAIAEVRRLSRLLSPGVTERVGLRGALQSLVAEIDGYPGIRCSIDCAELRDEIRDVEVATHLYRIAQESISNAIRHGRARSIVLRLGREADLVRLEIVDDGEGMPAEHDQLDGMGLRSMRYRARMINGSLEIGPRRSGHGTRVRCTCPVEPGG